MREIFTSGSVERALGNQCLYPETRLLEVLNTELYLNKIKILAVLMVIVIAWGIGDVIYLVYQRLKEAIS
jgi:hypothetical protein